AVSRFLFFLAADADARPGDRVESSRRDRLPAVTADAVGALLDAPQGFVDRLKDLGVGLLEFQLDVNLVVTARLVGHVALPAGIVLHRPLEWLRAGADQLTAFPEQRIPKNRDVHR